MKGSIIQAVLIAAALLLSASVCVAAESKAAAPVTLVDINSASRAQLKKIPGIGNAEADKIIAGRPYLSKAHLVTRNIISGTHYAQIKDQIIARQK